MKELIEAYERQGTRANSLVIFLLADSIIKCGGNLKLESLILACVHIGYNVDADYDGEYVKTIEINDDDRTVKIYSTDDYNAKGGLY